MTRKEKKCENCGNLQCCTGNRCKSDPPERWIPITTKLRTGTAWATDVCYNCLINKKCDQSALKVGYMVKRGCDKHVSEKEKDDLAKCDKCKHYEDDFRETDEDPCFRCVSGSNFSPKDKGLIIGERIDAVRLLSQEMGDPMYSLAYKVAFGLGYDQFIVTFEEFPGTQISFPIVDDKSTEELRKHILELYSMNKPREIPVSEGIKYDTGKPRIGEMIIDFAKSLLLVCKVWEFGAKKYKKSNWKKVENGWDRYTNAMTRHQLLEETEFYDTETGIPHAVHVAWNALARLFFLPNEIDTTD